MAELNVYMTYGNALYKAATELDMQETLLEEGLKISEILKEEPEFMALLKNPGISVAEKKEVLQAVFKDRCSKEMLNFMFVLIDKGRIAGFTHMIGEYKKLVECEEHATEGIIYSVSALSREQMDKFEEQTSKLFKEKVHLVNETDPHLIGGVRILVDGRIIDTSLRKRLDDMAGSLSL